MPFFLRRGRGGRGRGSNDKMRGKKRGLEKVDKVSTKEDEEISSESGSEDDSGVKRKNIVVSDSEDDTAMKKRFKDAKVYLERLEQEELDKGDDIDREAIAHRMQQDHLEKTGRLQRRLCHLLDSPPVSMSLVDKWTVLAGHRFPITCFVVSSDGKYAVSCSKNGEIIKWDIELKRKILVLAAISKKVAEMKLLNVGHCGDVKAVALSSDDKFLATGGEDKKIHIFDFQTMKRLKQFSHHRGAVNALAFRKGSHQLFSGGGDRAVKMWDIDEMGYVDTMFGHQDSVCCMDALSRERCITSGGRDRSIRIWKIAEESQLVFNAHSECGSVDCVRLINEEHFVSGSDDGSLCVWSVFKKKPVCIKRNAHQICMQQNLSWISSLATITYTDIIASGSNDGFVRLWSCAEDYKSLNLLHSIPLVGFINDLQFTEDGKNLVAAVSKEHKWGRWWKMDETIPNTLIHIPMPYKS